MTTIQTLQQKWTVTYISNLKKMALSLLLLLLYGKEHLDTSEEMMITSSKGLSIGKIILCLERMVM